MTSTKKTSFGSDALFIEGEYTEICFDKKWRDSEFEDIRNIPQQKIEISQYMDKIMVYNRSCTALFITLIHFHSVSVFRNTVYKLEKKENNMYEITWTNLIEESDDDSEE